MLFVFVFFPTQYSRTADLYKSYPAASGDPRCGSLPRSDTRLTSKDELDASVVSLAAPTTTFEGRSESTVDGERGRFESIDICLFVWRARVVVAPMPPRRSLKAFHNGESQMTLTQLVRAMPPKRGGRASLDARSTLGAGSSRATPIDLRSPSPPNSVPEPGTCFMPHENV